MEREDGMSGGSGMVVWNNAAVFGSNLIFAAPDPLSCRFVCGISSLCVFVEMVGVGKVFVRSLDLMGCSYRSFLLSSGSVSASFHLVPRMGVSCV